MVVTPTNKQYIFRSRRLNPMVEAFIPPVVNSINGGSDLTHIGAMNGMWDKVNTLFHFQEIVNGTGHPLFVKYRTGVIVQLNPCDDRGQCQGVIRVINGFKSGAYGNWFMHEDSEDYGGLNENHGDRVREKTREAINKYNLEIDAKPRVLERNPREVRGHTNRHKSPVVNPMRSYSNKIGDYEIAGYVDFPDTILRSEHGVFLQEADVVIAPTREVARCAIHPNSVMGKRLEEDFTRDDNKLMAGMYIVDNTNRYQERYTTIAGETLVVPCISSPMQLDGFYFVRPSYATATIGVENINTLFLSVEEADKRGIIRSKREEIAIEQRQDEVRMRNEKFEFDKQHANERLELEREKLEYEKEIKDASRRDGWWSSRIREALDAIKIIIPLAITLFTLFAKAKKA